VQTDDEDGMADETYIQGGWSTYLFWSATPRLRFARVTFYQCFWLRHATQGRPWTGEIWISEFANQQQSTIRWIGSNPRNWF